MPMGVTVREKVKGSGEYWIFVNHQGKRSSRKVGPRDKAEEAATIIRAKLVLNEHNLDAPKDEPLPTFADYSQLWLADYVKNFCRQSTYERYSQVLKNKVVPRLGKMRLDQIKKRHVRDVLMFYFRQGLSKSSVSIIKDAISGVMGYAEEAELISGNPAKGVTKRMNIHRQKKATVGQAFTPEETQVFLGKCLEYYPNHYPLFLVAFRTGMRLGELLALQWGDVDWHNCLLVVRRSYKNGRTSGTKTGRERRVDMSAQVVEALRELNARRKREAMQAGLGEVVPWIFHRDGMPIAQNSIRHYYKRTLRKAGLPDRRFHDIRHSFATQLLTLGQPVTYVKEQLGHSSIKITVDIYGHLIPGSNRDAVNQLDTLAPATHLSAPSHKEKAATPEDCGQILFMVPKGRLELPHP
ncbi:MAG: site-specific integrase [Deltaproteobacteria bacterium]|nr:site-specific integrase [Deltaproteobacteria bacterium]